jgi:hypothetical protein
LPLHPHGEKYLAYFLSVFATLPNVNDSTEFDPGWPHAAMVLSLLGLLGLLVLVARHRLQVSWQRMHQEGMTFLTTLVLLFTVAFLFWGRSIDFLWPLVLLLLGRLLATNPYVFQDTASVLLPRHALPLLPKLLAGTIGLVALTNVGKLAWVLASGDAQYSLAPIERTLTPLNPGTLVLNVDWDLFPAFFAVRSDLRYARGMDPGFDALPDPRGLALFEELQRLEVGEQLDVTAWLGDIQTLYPSDVLLLVADRHRTLAALLEEHGMRPVAEGEPVLLYEL